MRYVALSKDEMDAVPRTRAGGISQCIHTMVESRWNKPRNCQLWTMWMCLRDMAENDGRGVGCGVRVRRC